MTRIFTIMTTCAAIALAAQAAAETGFVQFDLQTDHHAAPLDAAMFYPAAAGGDPITFGRNPVFTGIQVSQDAPIADGNHPIVLMSHGLGGNYRVLSWLARDLAEAGAIVIAVNHPNSTTFDVDPQLSLHHWTRAQDMSAALDHVIDTYGDYVDTSRVMASGFSYGGWTALSLGGQTGNHAGYVSHCEEDAEASTHCQDIIRAGGDLAAIPAEDWNASYRDDRVTHVAAIDPGLIYGAEAVNGAGMEADALLIQLGSGENRHYATDIDRSGFGDVVAHERVTIDPAHHISALMTCRPGGWLFLKVTFDYPVCDDPQGSDRAAVHAQISAEMIEHFGLVPQLAQVAAD
ncbi:alpha/beta hydrolase family protein [Shimia ponticola]|uniref:alpha/beta hydrolase family protein n=1 Tax=Shimia ponticola TaxID=2582893 RepID=UPI0011BED048|nr:prolyl oligopeptidase family serine peptidase [Shimia ponticola]